MSLLGVLQVVGLQLLPTHLSAALNGKDTVGTPDDGTSVVTEVLSRPSESLSIIDKFEVPRSWVQGMNSEAYFYRRPHVVEIVDLHDRRHIGDLLPSALARCSRVMIGTRSLEERRSSTPPLMLMRNHAPSVLENPDQILLYELLNNVVELARQASHTGASEGIVQGKGHGTQRRMSSSTCFGCQIRHSLLESRSGSRLQWSVFWHR
ncbi:hypothetical protein F5Y15DRAFT_111894 [Xylariaceae sp. FL0016]|nr:hypothetical protein F5Y15DRAFT_111894 [Xylariaceae sp. FL0016]